MMTGTGMEYARTILVLLILCVAAQGLASTAYADDPEQEKALPGQWVFSLYADEQTEAEVDAAFLTLEKDGRLSLLCNGRDGEYIAAYAGTWSYEFVADGMDRLALRFMSTDHPAHAGSAYSAECTYSFYTEGWDENDTHYSYLNLEEPVVNGVSPLEEVYGEDAMPPLGLKKEQGPNMRVANCKSYVSLREKPATSSARRAKVSLGETVLAFTEQGEENGFVFCLYHGTYGYILTEYLEPLE